MLTDSVDWPQSARAAPSAIDPVPARTVSNDARAPLSPWRTPHAVWVAVSVWCGGTCWTIHWNYPWHPKVKRTLFFISFRLSPMPTHFTSIIIAVHGVLFVSHHGKILWLSCIFHQYLLCKLWYKDILWWHSHHLQEARLSLSIKRVRHSRSHQTNNWMIKP